jgi:outer membrane protein OmpA-like peptidoglycan-associated protein
MRILCTAAVISWHFASLSAQNVEGYVFEQFNRGFLQQVKVEILRLDDRVLVSEMTTDTLGHFAATLEGGKYVLRFKKDVFFERSDTILASKEKSFLKIELRRKPGYLFDATIAEARETPDQVVDAIQGANIEIYNRTQGKNEYVATVHPEAFFRFTFEQGNHYTMLIRKPGYLAKRIEAYVNVQGCIICIDGLRSMSPGVSENLTQGNSMGTLLGNIELEKVKLDKRIEIENIYYDYDKWDIRPEAASELDKVVTLMKDNPGLQLELGSHTDSRGNDEYNLKLSEKRAAAAVWYITSEGGDSTRIISKGYGESVIRNRCKNGIACSETEHQRNRRTELRITGVSMEDIERKQWVPLEQMILTENKGIQIRQEERRRRNKQ